MPKPYFHFLLLVCLLCITASVQCQTKKDSTYLYVDTAAKKVKSSAYIGITAGAGTPLGAFGHNNHTKTPFAKTGFCTTATIAVPIIGGFGYCMAMGYSITPTDVLPFVNSVAYSQISSASPYNVTNQQAGSFKEAFIMGGVCYTIPLNNFSFDLRVLIGDMSVIYPDASYTLVDPQGVQPTQNYTVKGGRERNADIDLGIGFRLQVIKHFAVIAHYNYTRSFGYYGKPYVLFTCVTAGVAYQF